MCGIAGFWGDSYVNIEANAKSMSNSISHRGPDDNGSYIDINNNLALVHRRLSILDLSDNSHQPMKSICGKYIMVFNGEIYNFLEIKTVIEKKIGTSISQTRSDSRILLHSISVLGLKKTLEIANGMFAIALWNCKNKSLTLARDRIGEKPLYYGWINNTFMFSSELKAMKAHSSWKNIEIDRESLRVFLMKSSVPAPYSIYKGVYKLRAGHTIKIYGPNCKRNDQEEYWSLKHKILDSIENPFMGSMSEGADELNKILTKSVGLRMISDAPIGAFLSGGYDSSLIVAIMQSISKKPVKTFTIGFEDKDYNEANYANDLSNYLGTEHSELYISNYSLRNAIPLLPSVWNEPFADNSQIPTLLLSKFASNDVKVVLSGDGSDEIFGGYNRYIDSISLEQRLSKIPSCMSSALTLLANSIVNKLYLNNTFENKLISKIKRKSYMLMSSPYERYVFGMRKSGYDDNIVLNYAMKKNDDFWWNNENKDILGFENKMFFHDMATYLPDEILVKLDRASMYFGLEARVPMLDPMLIDFAFRIPTSYKVDNLSGKKILKKVAHSYMPQRLLNRPKKGFGIPLDKWLRGELKEWASYLLSYDNINKYGYLSYDVVNKYWEQHISEKYNWQDLLWNILMFQAWLMENHEKH